jgi:F420 biosynthesis protein FbiB-like protein
MTARSQVLGEVIRGRSSVRAFAGDPVDLDMVRQAIEAAGWAPSPHGTQPWQFAVVTSEAKRKQLSGAMASTWRDQLQFDGNEPDIIERRLQLSQQRIERPPVVVVLCLDLARAHPYADGARQQAEYLMAVQSLGAAAQNFLLALHAAGLDAGWMCAPLFCPDIVRHVLDLPEDLVPHAMFPIGRAAAAPKRRPRRPVDELIAAWF